MKENKLENFINAVKRLNEARTAFGGEPDNTLYRDALIQRFEFTLELAWKTIREELIEAFFSEKELNSPRNVISKAYQENYIDDEKIWLDMLKERNNIAHIYSEEDAIAVADKIKTKFCKVLTKLSKSIK
ncbi:MAG: HI0074 family nucleotidyltransferase substrate-binding subunit [Bacillota bacterium]